jgi:hypothetical protein
MTSSTPTAFNAWRERQPQARHTCRTTFTHSVQHHTSIWWIIIGLLQNSTNGFGQLSVRGLSRVPKPPTRMRAFIDMVAVVRLVMQNGPGKVLTSSDAGSDSGSMRIDTVLIQVAQRQCQYTQMR